jgi:hypothetical protein
VTDKTETKTETTKVEKKAAPKKSSEDKYSHFERKDLVVDDQVLLTAQVESMSPGTLGVVKAVQFDGAVFVVQILNGPRHGESFRIKASDLELKRIPKSEIAQKESEGGN